MLDHNETSTQKMQHEQNRSTDSPQISSQQASTPPQHMPSLHETPTQQVLNELNQFGENLQVSLQQALTPPLHIPNRDITPTQQVPNDVVRLSELTVLDDAGESRQFHFSPNSKSLKLEPKVINSVIEKEANIPRMLYIIHA